MDVVPHPQHVGFLFIGPFDGERAWDGKLLSLVLGHGLPQGARSLAPFLCVSDRKESLILTDVPDGVKNYSVADYEGPRFLGSARNDKKGLRSTRNDKAVGMTAGQEVLVEGLVVVKSRERA
jgi:hypothetical protein